VAAQYGKECEADEVTRVKNISEMKKTVKEAIILALVDYFVQKRNKMRK
jgi:hypothetical protein